MRVLAAGADALLVEVADLRQVLALHAALAAHPVPGVVDTVPAARTVLVLFDPARTTADALRARLQALPLAEKAPPSGPVVAVPVRYDGPDLDEVGELTGLGRAGVVAAHTGQLWMVAFGGFAPGFGYLVGEDTRLEVPRKSTPRVAVAAGSVGLAGEFSGVYPHPSPGGWQLIGTTGAVLWSPDRDPPALLRPGVRVRFEEIR